MAHANLLPVRGEISDILLETTVKRIQAARPDMALMEVRRVGHAGTMTQARGPLMPTPVLDVLRGLPERVG
jgi:hypothetical protein